MTDNELFELCKEVYERTRWTDTLQCIWNSKIDTVSDYSRHWAEKHNYPAYAPLYTTDYLLEKLPRQIMSKPLEIYGYDEESGMYLVRYDVMELVPSNQGWYGARADTPLKALLKLTIALHEAGELA